MFRKSVVPFCIVAVVFLSLNVWARRGRKIDLKPALQTTVNSILENSTSFQEALNSQNQDMINAQVKALSISIDQAVLKMSDFSVDPYETHIKRILKSTKKYLEGYINMNDEKEKKTHLRKMFSQLVQLVRGYNVDNTYRIYFCNKDNSEWIQKVVNKNWRSKNPIQPNSLSNCGRPL